MPSKKKLVNADDFNLLHIAILMILCKYKTVLNRYINVSRFTQSKPDISAKFWQTLINSRSLTPDHLRHHVHRHGTDQEQVRSERAAPRPRHHPAGAHQAAGRDQGQGGHRGQERGPGHDPRGPGDRGGADQRHPARQLLLQAAAAGAQRGQPELHLRQTLGDPPRPETGCDRARPLLLLHL